MNNDTNYKNESITNNKLNTLCVKTNPIIQSETKTKILKSILKPYTPREDTKTLEELQEKLESLPNSQILGLQEAIKNRAKIQPLNESETIINNFKRSKNTNYAAYPNNKNYNERIIKTKTKIHWAPHIQDNEFSYAKIINAFKLNAFQLATHKSNTHDSIKCLSNLKQPQI